jgi:hypothetical protein
MMLSAATVEEPTPPGFGRKGSSGLLGLYGRGQLRRHCRRRGGRRWDANLEFALHAVDQMIRLLGFRLERYFAVGTKEGDHGQLSHADTPGDYNQAQIEIKAAQPFFFWSQKRRRGSTIANSSAERTGQGSTPWLRPRTIHPLGSKPQTTRVGAVRTRPRADRLWVELRCQGAVRFLRGGRSGRGSRA